MSISARFQQEFDSRIRTKGNGYFHQQRVTVESDTPGLIHAIVRGHGDDYVVKLDLTSAAKGEMSVSCSCPYFEGYSCCKHIWATILRAEPKLASAPFPRTGRLLISEDRSFLDDLDSDDSEDEYDASGEESLLSHRRSALRRATSESSPSKHEQQLRENQRWRLLLDAVKQQSGSASGQRGLVPLVTKARQTRFVLDLASSSRYGLVIELRQRETKQNGEFGIFKPLKIGRSDLRTWPDPLEADLLRTLLVNDESPQFWQLRQSYSNTYANGNYESKGSTFLLSPAAYDYLLPRLCQSGRFFWTLSAADTLEEQGKQVTWDDGLPWRLRLAITADQQASQWELTGQLVRDGGSPLPLSAPALLLRDGLMLHEGTLSRLEAAQHFAWIELLRREERLRIPFADRAELLKRLWSQVAIPEMELCEGLRLPEQRAAPQGVVRLSPYKEHYLSGRLRAAVRFNYQGREIPWNQAAPAVVDEAAESVLIRDAAAELQLLQELASLGFKEKSDYYGRNIQDDLDLPLTKLAKVVDQLSANSWTVEAEGKLIRRAGAFKLSVTSGLDWFGLDGEVDFGGVTAHLPELLAAIRKGEKYIKLGDGTQGILPEEWLAKFGNLAALGAAEDGQVRFKPSQALLLDALLASQPDVALDKQFSAWRKKLQSFHGVKPKNEPRGFVGKLRDYQRDGLGWLHFLREFSFGGCLADDMGLGKTIQVLSLLQSLKARRGKEPEPHLPSLVVVPRSLVFNWQQEAARFSPQLKVLDFAHKERGQQWNQLGDFDLIITTYGTLIRDIIKLKDVPFEYAILDEAQAIKNSNSQSAKACRLLTAKHRLAMSGTPIENHLGELWSLFEFLNPGMLGQSEAFRRFSTAGAEGEDKSNLQTLSKAIAPFVLRRTKAQVLKELPEKTEQTIYCDLSPKERKAYNQLREYYQLSLASRIESDGLAKSKIHVLEALLRLRQAACHNGLLDENKKKETSAKLEVLLEQLEEIVAEGHKVLVFSQFTKLLDIVRNRLDAQNTVYEYLDGKTRDRQARVDRFQSDAKCPVFLVSLKAGGRGLNLTAADYVFILDPWWNPAVEAQAVDRAHRIGQTRPVFAYRLIARDTVEEKILELQNSKRDLAEAIISADGSLLQNLTAEDLRALLS